MAEDNGPSAVRKNLQVKQPGIVGYDVADGDGWPEPLVDPSNPLKMAVTNGSNGEQRNFQAMSTSRQNELSLTEGKSPSGQGDATQGDHENKFQTSQMNPPNHSEPEGE